ncbi:hypothetical protein FBU30_004399 [Linnemannia zychae]|nr:hypothetical protein FBU30_004399 [Linnemannia zychae]
MTTRYTVATPAPLPIEPAPATAPQVADFAQQPQPQPQPPLQQKDTASHPLLPESQSGAITPLASATPINPASLARVDPNVVPPPVVTPQVLPSTSLSQSFPHAESSFSTYVSSPINTLDPQKTTTVTTSSSTNSDSSKHHPSPTHHEVQPSGTPSRVVGNSSESNNRIMLMASLIAVFVVLAGMGLVVYCLFRRRSAKRRIHLFGSVGNNKNALGSLDSSVAGPTSGNGGGGRKSFGENRSNSKSLSVGGISSIGNNGCNDPMAAALAAMQEQQRRISDLDVSRASQVMTEQHQAAMMARRVNPSELQSAYLPDDQKHSLSAPASSAATSFTSGNASASCSDYVNTTPLEGAGVGTSSGDSLIPRTSSPLHDLALKQSLRPQSTFMLQNNYSAGNGLDRARSPPLTSSSTGDLLHGHSQHHRGSQDGIAPLVIPPSITTRPRSIMPSPASPPSSGYTYQQGYPQLHGQEYYLEDPSRQYSSPPSSRSPYGNASGSYQDQHRHSYAYRNTTPGNGSGRSSTQLFRESDQKIDLAQEGAGVGTGPSTLTLLSLSSSSLSSGTALSNHDATHSKSPPSTCSNNSKNGKAWSARSNHSPKVHIAPPPLPNQSRASTTAAAAGLTIAPPAADEQKDLQLTEILNSPTDSSIH